VLVEADGLSFAQRFLNERRLEMPCWALGRMRTLFDDCVHELAHRIRYRQPVTEMQAVQAAIGRMFVSLTTSRIVVLHMLDRIDLEEHDLLWDAPLAVSKCHVVDAALELCRTIQDIAGGAAVFEDCAYERHVRDLMCLNAIAGTLATLEVDLGIVASLDVERRIRKGAARGGTR
jgi:alkylation response protein AidB-like acyl-CoA dehydrogenase